MKLFKKTNIYNKKKKTMNKLTLLLSNLITEASRLEDVYNKYVKPNPKLSQPGQPPRAVMTFDVFKKILSGDPTTLPKEFDYENATVKDLENLKLGRYTQWLFKVYVTPVLEFERGTEDYKAEAKEYRRLFVEDIEKINVDLLKYDRFKQRLPLDKREIMKISLQELYSLVEEFKLSKDTKSNKEERITKENPFQFPGSKIDIETPDWTVVKISDKGQLGKDAACYFGGYYDINDEFDETSWCTGKHDGTNFKHYINKNPLYVILPNNATEFGQKTGLPKERYQFHFPETQFMNRNDKQINLVDFFENKAPDLKEYFRPMFDKYLKGGVSITSDVTRGAATISLVSNRRNEYSNIYGKDKNENDEYDQRIIEIFDELPTSVTRIILTNKTAEEIYLDIPNSLGKFTNLEGLSLEKCVKSIPDTICNLKKLGFLNINDCQNITELPDCIVGMINDELTILNLKNSNPNIRIPELFYEYKDDQKPYFYVFP